MKNLKRTLKFRSVIFSFILFLSLSCPITFSAQTAQDPDGSVAIMREIQKDFQNGKWELGKQKLDLADKKFPNDSDFKMLAGRYYQHKKQYDEARYELSKSLILNAKNVAAKQILVNVEQESKRYSSAICYVNELLEVNPYWKGLWEKKIELYKAQGNQIEAQRLAKRLYQIYPNDKNLQKKYIYELEEEAGRLRKNGKIKEVVELSSEMLTLAPHNPSHYLQLINDLGNSGDKVSAVAMTERALQQFPGNQVFINKKIGMLEEQNRYPEILTFIESQLRYGNAGDLRRQYSYYLLEAARSAKNHDPATLYGKIFMQNRGNIEAFNYVFNSAVATQQYEEALAMLNTHRRFRGGSKELSLKELMVFQRMGNTSRADGLTKQLYQQYPSDTDLKAAYSKILIREAKDQMDTNDFQKAIITLSQIRTLGYPELNTFADNALYQAFMGLKDYHGALDALSGMQQRDPSNPMNYIRKADIYYLQKRYDNALGFYEQAIDLASTETEKANFLGSYGQLQTQIIKQLNEDFQYEQSLEYTDRWIQKDPTNEDALKYGVNLSLLTNDPDKARTYAERGSQLNPENSYFTLKLLEDESKNVDSYREVLAQLNTELEKNPYNPATIGLFSDVSGKYGQQLLKNKQPEEALSVLKEASKISPENKELKFQKGLAYEQLKKYDSAFSFQKYYEPSVIEESEYKSHMNYLLNKTYKNEIGIHHLRSRFGNEDKLTTISTVEYTRLENKNTYIARVNYTGRDTGKGVQIQGEWLREWNNKTRTLLNAAWANEFFPSIAINGSVFRDINIWKTIEGEVGLGYRRLPTGEDLLNLTVGATKEWNEFRLNTKFTNYSLDGKWLYNLSANTRYYLASPKSYIHAMGSIGSSPDVDVLDQQLYNGFSVTNTTVGLGFNQLLTKSVSAGVTGSWNHYKASENAYKNLYNIYLSLNVSF